MSELKIEVPEGMEAYIEGDVIKFRQSTENVRIRYEYVAENLFKNKEAFYIGNYAKINPWVAKENKDTIYENICTTENQAKKLMAINKLMNVSKYLNEGWKFINGNIGYYLYLDGEDSIYVSYNCSGVNSVVYFKTEELAMRAIEILGYDTVKLALSTDW